MKFLTILSLLSVGAFAAAIAEPEAEANAGADALLEQRVNCGQILPVCASGTKIGTSGCQCRGRSPRVISGPAQGADAWFVASKAPAVCTFKR
ncbi:hypothetical protein G7Y79_00004g012290 [Physcia stellaris]|nr:hypothetical protein G7Y79_00004g012290 [Physcia stellaris]